MLQRRLDESRCLVEGDQRNMERRMLTHARSPLQGFAEVPQGPLQEGLLPPWGLQILWHAVKVVNRQRPDVRRSETCNAVEDSGTAASAAVKSFPRRGCLTMTSSGSDEKSASKHSVEVAAGVCAGSSSLGLIVSSFMRCSSSASESSTGFQLTDWFKSHVSVTRAFR